MSYQVDRLAQAIVRRIARGRPRRKPASRMTAAVASAVVRRRGPPSRRPGKPVGLAAAVASVVARRLAPPSVSSSRPPNKLASALASAVSARLGAVPPAATAAPDRPLVGGRIASSVTRQIASRIPKAQFSAETQLASLDPAKVAAAVVAELESRKAKAVDHTAIFASQIARRLTSPVLQGSAPAAAEFAKQLATAVAHAIAQQQQPKAEEQPATTPEQPQDGAAEKPTSKAKRAT